MMKKIGIIALLGLIMQSCGKEKVIFEHDYTVQNATWRYGDTLDFGFDIADTTRLYDIVLNIDHSVDFPMQNMYTRVYTQFPNGQRLAQVVSIDLADNTGKWLGKASGKTVTLSLPIQTKAYFNQTGRYKITFEQYSRTESLTGVSEIGLSVVDLGETRPAAAPKKGQ